MHLKRTIKTLALAAIMLTGSQTSQAQDLLARQAPVDRKMKAVDTLALRNLIDHEQAQMPGVNLYEDWNNVYAHKATQLPDSFRINLRHFCMPTPSRIITSGFGARWGRMHKGLDIKVYIGDTIRAAFSGKVRIVKYEPAGYGNYVVIRHNNGLETIYGHMSKHLCHENQIVKAGDVIGLGGNTGRSTGSHLHFETRICGVALNPALLFDFVHQDVTCDSYLFRRADYEKNNRSVASAKNQQRKQAPQVSINNDDNAIAYTNTYDKSRKNRRQQQAEEKAAEKQAKAEAKANKKAQKDAEKQNLKDAKQNKKDANAAARQEKNDAKAAAKQSKKDLKAQQKQDKKNTKANKKTAKAEKTHKVVQGDNLYTIARKQGISINDLCKKNGLKPNSTIKPGQTLKV